MGLSVIFLTSKDEEVDEILGLQMGADDYITKPVRLEEVISALKRWVPAAMTAASIPKRETNTKKYIPQAAPALMLVHTGT